MKKCYTFMFARKALAANSKDLDFKASKGWLKKLRKEEVEFTVYLDKEM